MHDIRAIRENPAQFTAGLARRGMADAQAITDDLLERDRDLRAVQVRLRRRRRNATSLAPDRRAKAQKDETRPRH